MIRVAHVATVPETLDVLLGRQLAYLARRYDVAAISAPGPAAARLEVPHVAVPFVRSSALTPGADLAVIGHLVRVFRRERYTIVHTHTAKPDVYAAVAARIARVPIVVTTLHGFVFDERTRPMRRKLLASLAGIGMRCCDAVLSQNDEDIATARRERIGGSVEMQLLGNGIDLERFDPTRIDRAAVPRIRAGLGIAADALVVGFVGRLVAEKGVLELLEAIPALRARFPKLRVLFIGPIDEAKRDAIGPEIAAERGLGDTCVFTGYRTDLPELYAAMDVCVLPSHREGFPRTPMEASAMGIPVVATDIRGCRSAVDHGRTGLLVPLRDVAALRDALAALLADPALRARMSAEGRVVARSRFDEREVFGRVERTYAALLARRGSRS